MHICTVFSFTSIVLMWRYENGSFLEYCGLIWSEPVNINEHIRRENYLFPYFSGCLFLLKQSLFLLSSLGIVLIVIEPAGFHGFVCVGKRHFWRKWQAVLSHDSDQTTAAPPTPSGEDTHERMTVFSIFNLIDLE